MHFTLMGRSGTPPSRSSAVAAGILLLVFASRAVFAQPRPVSVAVDLTALSRGQFRAIDAVALEKMLVVRLIQEGFAVVTPSNAPDLTLIVATIDGSLFLQVGALERKTGYLNEPIAELHLELAQKAVELLRQAATRTPVPEVAPDIPAEVARPSPQPVARAQVERVAILLGMGASWRAAPVDPLVQLSARVALGPRFGLAATGGWSLARSSEVTAHEGLLRLGPGVHFDLSEAVRVDLALMGGAVWHVFTLTDLAAPTPSGVRIWPVAMLETAIGFRPGSHWLMAVRVATGISPAFEHLDGQRVMLGRSAFRLELGLSTGICF